MFLYHFYIFCCNFGINFLFVSLFQYQVMQKFSFILLMLAFTPYAGLLGQNNPDVRIAPDKIQTVSVKNDTVVNVIQDQHFRLLNPEVSKEYSISRYKNIDFLKINPLQLDALGLHSEIYISNTPQGVIIISLTEPYNNLLTDYYSILEASTTFYNTDPSNDTLVISTDDYNSPVFDFTRASRLRQDYKNAYNYSVDPRTRISVSRPSDVDYFLINPYTGKYWNKNSDEFYNQEWGRIQGLNELVIVFPRLNIK